MDLEVVDGVVVMEEGGDGGGGEDDEDGDEDDDVGGGMVMVVKSEGKVEGKRVKVVRGGAPVMGVANSGLCACGGGVAGSK